MTPGISKAPSLKNKSLYLCIFAIITLCVLGLSQFVGYLVNTSIAVNTTVEVNSLIHFTHIRNYGGVFGLLQGQGWVFGIISLILLSAVVIYLWRGEAVRRYEYFCFGFIVGGGASNILDRYVYGSVIDFIDIQNIPFWNYIFNTADVMVHVGIWPMLFLSLFPDQAPFNKGPIKNPD